MEIMNNPVCLGLSNLDISKISIYEYWYKYLKLKYGNNVKIYFMDTGSFRVHVEKKDVYANLATGKNKKGIKLIKGKLGEKY